jgi:hypothetical protein
MLRLVAVAVGLAVAAGCGRPEENAVTPAQMASTLIPPVDRETPARLETATFAVG